MSELKEELVAEEQALEQFLEKEENRQNALRLANHIRECVGDNWFSVNRLVSKSGESRETAFQKIQLCKMFGLAEQKIGNYRDGKDSVRMPLFKITISKEDKIRAYQQIIRYHLDQINHFELQIKQLNS